MLITKRSLTKKDTAFLNLWYSIHNYESERKERFSFLLEKVKPYSMIGPESLIDVWTAISYTAEIPVGVIIEVGVWRGGSGGLISRHARDLGIQDNIYLCDTFTGVPKAGEHDTCYKGGEHSDTSVDVVENLLYNILGLDSGVIILTGVFPEDSASKIKEPFIRLCHIDADVYQSAKDILEWVWPRLVVGGVVVYDDYGALDLCPGIKKHVEEHREDEDKVIFMSKYSKGIMIKV